MPRFSFIFLFFLLLGLVNTRPGFAEATTETAFSPSPDAIRLIVRTIDEAKTSIDVAAYSFTSKPVSEALLAAHRRGVAIRVLLDKSQGKRHYKAAEILRDAGIPIRINRRYAIMHNKYLIIDGKTVETGSFNFTANAQKRNAENVIVIKDDAAIAKLYMANWEKLWNEGEAYSVGASAPPQTSEPQQAPQKQTAPREPKLSSRAYCKIVKLLFDVFSPHAWQSSYSSLCRVVLDLPNAHVNGCEEPGQISPQTSFPGSAPASPLHRPCAAPASP